MGGNPILAVGGDACLSIAGAARREHARHRHPAHRFDLVTAMVGNLADSNRSLALERGGRDKLGKPLDEPARIGGFEILQHEMMGIFMEQYRRRKLPLAARHHGDRAVEIGSVETGGAVTACHAHRFMHIGDIVDQIDAHLLRRALRLDAGKQRHHPVHRFQPLAKPHQFAFRPARNDDEVRTGRLAPFGMGGGGEQGGEGEGDQGDSAGQALQQGHTG